MRIQNEVRDQIKAGDFAAVEASFRECRNDASRAGDPVGEVRCLSGEAGALMARYEYQRALAAYLEAKELAARIGDRADLAAVDANLSSLYQQVFDFGSAVRAGDEGLAAIRQGGDSYYKPQLILQSGRLHASTGKDDGEALFREGIQAARAAEGRYPNQNFAAVEAQGWDLLGESRMQHGDLHAADQAFETALSVRSGSSNRDAGYSYAHLGNLRLEQARAERNGARKQVLLQEASGYTERAIAEQAAGRVSLPLYQLRYQKGDVLLATGNTVPGLEELESAVELAERWRAGIPRAFSSINGSATELDERVAAAFIQAAAEYGIRTGNQRWIRESFEAAEMNRVLGLRESQALAEIWRRKLPVEFWETLGKLRSEDARILRAGGGKSPLLGSLRLKLTEMEVKAGVGFSMNNPENFRNSNSLIRFQRRLGESQVLLSFDLEAGGSYLWAVTRDSLNAYRLPPQGQIAAAVSGFRQVIEDGRSDSTEWARKVYRMLFGRLSPKELQKRQWLLSLDGALFDLPFAALVPERSTRRGPRFERVSEEERFEGRDKFVYLAELHSLEVVPGAFLNDPGGPQRRQTEPLQIRGRFLGVGDPIYNVADSRWQGSHARSSWLRQTSTADVGGQFNRLPGAGREVEASAIAWNGPGTSTVVLEGQDARRSGFLNALSPAPAIIHLATHVVSPNGSPGEAFIAFGLGEQGHSELLSTTEVAMLRVPGALVVLTGCGTAARDSRPETGLQGLTRAWSIAGARAVVATLWHVRDSDGELISDFYRHLRVSKNGLDGAAEALRLSQVAMIRSGTALSAPSAWASYQVFQGDRQ